jgi:hypothetical protein
MILCSDETIIYQAQAYIHVSFDLQWSLQLTVHESHLDFTLDHEPNITGRSESREWFASSSVNKSELNWNCTQSLE